MHCRVLLTVVNMTPTSVLFCAIAVLLLGESQSFKVNGEHEHTTFHEYREIDNACKDADYAQKFVQAMRNSTCDKPLEAIVILNSRDSNYEYFPSHVKVPRCDGSCPRTLSCMPTKTEDIDLQVRRRDRSTNQMTCGIVTVKKHIKCMCKCEVMEHHCNKVQDYDGDDCMCKCKVNGKDKCQEKGRHWNSKRCQCECLETGDECSTGLEWVPRMCSCMRVSEPE